MKKLSLDLLINMKIYSTFSNTHAPVISYRGIGAIRGSYISTCDIVNDSSNCICVCLSNDKKLLIHNP